MRALRWIAVIASVLLGSPAMANDELHLPMPANGLAEPFNQTAEQLGVPSRIRLDTCTADFQRWCRYFGDGAWNIILIGFKDEPAHRAMVWFDRSTGEPYPAGAIDALLATLFRLTPTARQVVTTTIVANAVTGDGRETEQFVDGFVLHSSATEANATVNMSRR